MTLFLGLLAAVVGAVIWRALTVRALSDPAPLGRMSERWLAEYRASSQS